MPLLLFKEDFNSHRQ